MRSDRSSREHSRQSADLCYLPNTKKSEAREHATQGISESYQCDSLPSILLVDLFACAVMHVTERRSDASDQGAVCAPALSNRCMYAATVANNNLMIHPCLKCSLIGQTPPMRQGMTDRHFEP